MKRRSGRSTRGEYPVPVFIGDVIAKMTETILDIEKKSSLSFLLNLHFCKKNLKIQ
jgi:hypothetical protein